jgi:hypothetical protein
VKAYDILVGKPEGKGPFERIRRRWKDIRLYRREIGWGGVEWMPPAQNRNHWRDILNTAMNLRVLMGSFLTI